MARTTRTDWETFRFPIEGKMTASVVEELRDAILPLLGCFQVIEIDLSQVSEFDEAGLLLMMDAKLEAVVRNRTLRFIDHSKPVIDEILASAPRTWIMG